MSTATAPWPATPSAPPPGARPAAGIVDGDLAVSGSTFRNGPPHEAFDRLRAEGGIAWHGEPPAAQVQPDTPMLQFVDSPGFWVVTSHALVSEVDRDQPPTRQPHHRGGHERHPHDDVPHLVVPRAARQQPDVGGHRRLHEQIRPRQNASVRIHRAARTTYRPSSTARTAPCSKCWYAADDRWNHASLVIVTSNWLPRKTNARAIHGYTDS